MTSSKNLILLLSESKRVKSVSGYIIFNGMPGKPAPVPISTTLSVFLKEYTQFTARLSTKCLITTSLYSVIPVRFINSFHSHRSLWKLLSCSHCKSVAL